MAVQSISCNRARLRRQVSINTAPKESGLTDGTELRSDNLLLRRPHFHLQGSTLYWVGSKQPHRQFSRSEVELWNLMQRPLSVGEAREVSGKAADALIREFLSAGLCELAEPSFPTEQTPGTRH